MISHYSLPSIVQSMRDLVMSPHYPCVPAVRSYERGEYMVELCPGEFGSGSAAKIIAEGLKNFRERQQRTKEPFLSFWAVWDHQELDEDEHDERFWRELSHVAAQSDAPWDPNFSPDPSSKRFCFSFEGEAYFVVGLHSNSARKARQFPFPTIIFNLYSQFEDLATKGAYDAVVKTNRKREMAFQGNLNPMVEKYADSWEAIAFSGKGHGDDWRCPFQHLGASNATQYHQC